MIENTINIQELRKQITEDVCNGLRDMLQSQQGYMPMNLDNCTDDVQNAPEGGNLMAYKRMRYPVGRDENGKFITKQVSGKNDCECILAAVDQMFGNGFLQKERPGFFALPVAMQAEPKVYHRFEDVAYEWYNVECPKKIERKKLGMGLWKGSYKSNLANHVLPYFKEWNVEDIRLRHLQEFVYSLVNPKTEEFYAKATIEQINTILKQIVDFAAKQEYIPETPWKVGMIDNPSEKESTKTPLSKAEWMYVRSMIPTLETELERQYMILMAYLPYRPSEAFGQRWEDISFSCKPFCEVTGTVVIEDGQAVYHKGKGKNKQSLRRMIATSAMMKALAPYKKDVGFVLNNDGAHLSRKEMESLWRSIKRQIPLLEEKGITPYCFRHTYATIMYHETKDANLVAAQCGHISSKITKEVYIHDDIEYRRAAVNQMEATLAS